MGHVALPVSVDVYGEAYPWVPALKLSRSAAQPQALLARFSGERAESLLDEADRLLAATARLATSRTPAPRAARTRRARLSALQADGPGPLQLPPPPNQEGEAPPPHHHQEHSGLLLAFICGLSLLAAVGALRVFFLLPSRGGRDADADAAAAPCGRSWVVLMLCAVSAVEGADVALLPSCMYALQLDLHLRPSGLATMAMWQALLTATTAPVWGVLADRAWLTRRCILTIGCAGWGLATVSLAMVDSWVPMLALRALNGAMLASLRPISNGLVPDITPESDRGKVYGQIQLSMDLGSLVAGALATPVSTQHIAGIQGWRVAFALVGMASLVLSGLVAATMEEPKMESSAPAGEGKSAPPFSAVAAEEGRRLLGYLRTPTFALIVLQGIFGMVPWCALGYLSFFLQTAGLSDARSAAVAAIGRAFTGVGHLLGGYVGDACAVWSPSHGRPLVAQVSVLAGIACVWLLFCGLPPAPETFAWYCLVYSVMGVTATWCATGVNWPMFTEIVPPEGRCTVVAWDTALEGVSGAVFGNLAVAFLAEEVFGYSLEASDQEQSADNAHALGRALAWTTCAPFAACFVFYSLMHWSYGHDLQRMAILAKMREESQEEPASKG